MAVDPIKFALHKALVKVQEIPREQRPGDMGICLMVGENVDRTEHWTIESGVRLDHMLSSLFKRWPDGTHCPGYPVPSAIEGVWEGDAYYRAQERRALWQGEYGDKRCELLEWLIEQTKV